MKRIHIISTGPRTGTTLLHEVMKVSFKIDKASIHEDSIVRSNSSFGDCKIILTKNPGEFLSIKLPLFFDPNLYIICLVRDPRDTVVSYHGACPDQYYCSLKYWKVFCDYYDKLKEHDRITFIRYEDFTKYPDRVQEIISNKIPFLESNCTFSKYHLQANPSAQSLKALKQLRPIDSKGIGKWKKHLPRIKEQLSKHGDISESLIRFGYECDASWKDLLSEVSINGYETKTDEYFTDKELYRRKRRGYYASVNILIERIGLNADQILRPIKRILRFLMNKSKN